MEERSKYLLRTSSPKTICDKGIGLDLSSRGLHHLSTSLFLLEHIRELILDHNEIEVIPSDIKNLRKLEKLSLAHNKLRSIPAEMGKLVTLKELWLNDNNLLTVPMELGTLYNLEVLNLQNNPLIPPFSSLAKDRSLIHFCRENNTGYPAPSDRAWIDVVLRKSPPSYTLSVGTYNILCNFFASKLTYAPTWVINPDVRKETILQNIISFNVDILCLQEIEAYSYSEFYRDNLGTKLGYASVFQARERSRIFSDKRAADGAAVFWKKDKFSLTKHSVLDFNHLLLEDRRFANDSDIAARMARKDNIVLIVFLKDKAGRDYIVMNVHLYWHPDYADVKLFQTILLLEEAKRLKEQNPGASLLLTGDFNSLPDSSVYNLIIKRSVDGSAFGLYNYAPFENGFSHGIDFSDSYKDQELTFTNFTPEFMGVLDYIFHDSTLETVSILSPVEMEYSEKCVGLPSIHFPSDHIFIGARFLLKGSSDVEEEKTGGDKCANK